MDKEQGDLRFLGLLSIFKESFKIISKFPKIFTQISLAFIVPLSCLSLLNLELTKFLSPNHNEVPLRFWLIKVATIVLGLVLSLFSVSAVVYTVACVYTSKDFTFRKVVSVVPKVWKRLMITFLCNLGILFTYTFVSTFVAIVISTIVIFSTKSSNLLVDHQVAISIIAMFYLVVFLLGLIYMALIWQLANVVSVMEKFRGMKAMNKSRDLIKGKMGCAVGIMLVLGFCSVPQLLLTQRLKSSTRVRIWYGVLYLAFSTMVMLYGLVVQTVFYIVCKSYHHENIDKTSLADHLEAYHEDYIPLKNEVQL